MSLRTSLALAFGVLALSANAAPTTTSLVDDTVKVMADGASRNLGKSAAFCTASHAPLGTPMDERLRTYLAAMRSGTREAMLEIAAKDSSFVSEPPVLNAKALEMIDRQADVMLQAVKSSPARGCAMLADNLDSGTSAYFKKITHEGYREYLSKRAEYCARSPKPANCK